MALLEGFLDFFGSDGEVVDADTYGIVNDVLHRRALSLRAATRLGPFGFPNIVILRQERRVF